MSNSESTLLRPLPVTLLAASSISIPLLYFLLWHKQPHSRRTPKGKRLGIAPDTPSNLSDEFTLSSEGSNDESQWKVKALFVFPVKSCRGIELNSTTVFGSGLQYDRIYSFAEYEENEKTGESGWKFITQRQYPLLAKVKVEVYVDEDSATGGTVVLSFPKKGILGIGETWQSFDVPLDASEEYMSKFPLESLKVWKDSPTAYNVGSLLPPELVQFLGVKKPLTLFRASKSHLRPVYRNAPRKEELGRQTEIGFADAYPIQLMATASVRDVATKVSSSIPNLSIDRYRGNIIITGPPAYDEDSWKRVAFGEHLFHSVCRSARCKLPNVDQDTGVKHPTEPDRTLRQYRKIDPGCKLEPCLGMMLVPDAEVSTVRVGDPVKVLERGEHLYIRM